MKIEQQFTLDQRRDQVWAFFQDVPAVADCLPGAEYLGKLDDGSHSGRMSMKVGPFQASFEGVANVDYNGKNHTVAMSGKGVDKRGASRGKMTMDCAIDKDGDKTRVTVNADVQLSGSIAQFGRTGIIQEIAATLITDFVANVEEALRPVGAVASATPAPKKKKAPASGTRLLWFSLKSWVRSWFRSRR